MPTNLDTLKQFLRPATVDEVRRARLPEEQAPDEPGFVDALEAEMREDMLSCARAVEHASGISFEGTLMERASPWNGHPTAEQFESVATSPGPFPELRDKDL